MARTPTKSDVACATALGNACDEAVKRFLAASPRDLKALQRAIATVYLSGVQQATSTIIVGDGLPIAQQLDRAVDMVASAMGFTKRSGREDPGGDTSRLILPSRG